MTLSVHRWVSLAMGSVVFFALSSSVQAVSLVEIITGLTNWGSCLDFRIEGTCSTYGILVSYRSTIDELAGAIGGVAELVPGGGALGNLGEWNLQYSESHIVEYPIQLAMALHAIPLPPQYWCLDQMQYGFGLTINYLSEHDGGAWRTNTLPEEFGSRIGVWAPLAPRNGFCIHYSPAVASGVFGYRGAHIAWIPGLHVVLKPLWFALDPGDDRMQLAIPVVKECLEIGSNPLLWDHGNVSLDGKYLWLYWHRVRCCVPAG
jgi:hypothetical protein